MKRRKIFFINLLEYDSLIEDSGSCVHKLELSPGKELIFLLLESARRELCGIKMPIINLNLINFVIRESHAQGYQSVIAIR